MSTKYITAKGYLNWAHVYEPDVFGEGEAAAIRYIVDFIPFDELEKDKIIESGSRLRFDTYKNSDSDEERIRIRRDQFRKFGDEVVEYCPPALTGLVDVKYVDQNGKQIWSFSTTDGTEMKRVGDTVSLWNGTVANVTMAVYDTSFGKGTRLQNIEILELGKAPEETQNEDEKVEDTSPSSTNPEADEMPF